MRMTLLELFALGKWAMWPLLIFSIATISLIIERAIFLTVHRLNVARLARSVLNLVEAGDEAEARELCRRAGPRFLVASIFVAAFDARRIGKQRLVERAMEAGAAKAVRLIERGLDLLIALGSIAPITGFLGTVSGMIAAFNSIATAVDVNAQLVASGIFEALITTAYGLAIAIVAITAYNIFVHIADRFASDVEEAGNALISAFAAAGPKKKSAK